MSVLHTDSFTYVPLISSLIVKEYSHTNTLVFKLVYTIECVSIYIFIYAYMPYILFICIYTKLSLYTIISRKKKLIFVSLLFCSSFYLFPLFFLIKTFYSYKGMNENSYLFIIKRILSRLFDFPNFCHIYF